MQNTVRHLRTRIFGKTSPQAAKTPARRRRSLAIEQLENRHLLAAAPTLLPLSNVTLLAGAPLQIPINATSPSGATLTYSVSSTNPAITADLQTGNPDLVLNITHTASSQAGDTSFSGTIVIELFPNAAPNAVQQIEDLAESGSYNGIDFYRIVPGFVAQAGLDGATPPENASAVTLDDEFNPALPLADPTQPLRYSSAGVVGVARTAADDSGSTEFFITTTATSSFLDYQYTVFGQVVSGGNILTEIGNVPNDSTNNNLPFSPVTITSAAITTDNNDFALGLTAPLGTTGTGSVTVTANDGSGGTTSQTFQVTVQADPNDPGPVLNTIPTVPGSVTTTVNTPVSFQLSAFDLEGDPITYFDQTGLAAIASSFPSANLTPTQAISSDLNFSVNSTTGMVTVTPTNGLVGVTPMFFGVDSSTTPNSAPNTQMVPLFIDPAAPTGISLVAGSDSGSSSSDDITSLNNSDTNHELQFLVTGVSPGCTVILMDGSTQIGSAVATTSTVVITTDGFTVLADGSHRITAEQSLEDQQYTVGNTTRTTNLTSAVSSALSVTVDTAAPTFASTPTLTATVETPYSYTAQATDEVSSGLSYSVVSGPAGFSINASTGVVTWAPTFAEAGDNPIEIAATDLAGNTANQSFTVVASFAPLAVASITPSDGTTNVPINSAILVQFNNPMNSDTLNASTLLLQDSMGGTVAATISFDSNDGTASITPTAPLANSASYTVTVVGGEVGVTDTDGDTLSDNVTASFTTEAPLSVVSVTPADGSTAVPVNSSIAVAFDNAMNATTLNSSTLVLEDAQENVIAASVSYNSATDTATITPSALLSTSTAYTLTIVSGADGVADSGGETLGSDVTATFTTAAAPTVLSVTPVNDATGVTVTSVVVEFSAAMNSTTVNGGTVKLEDSTGNITAATVAYNSGSDTATLTPTGPLAPGATYLVFVEGGASGVTDATGAPIDGNFVSSFTTATGVGAPTPGPGEATIFSNMTVPSYSDNPDNQAVELGVQFQTSESGFIVGIRFYKGASSSGTNVGNLWSSTGTLLATATFTNETASGWQEVNFSQPVAVQAGATFVASYFAPNGNYADDQGFFANGSIVNGPLTALGSVFVYNATSAFPTQTILNSNYYVDVVFSQLTGEVSPALASTGIATDSAITVPFLTAMNADTISSSTLQLEDSSNNVVPATVTYDSGSNTATLTPSSALNSGATYTVVITGGAAGVADSNGDTMSANITWTFTTAPSAPAVLSVTPPDSATGFDTNSPIQVKFNEAMNASTILSGTVMLQDSSGDNVPETVSYNSNNDTATLTPNAALNASATYTVVVKGGAEGVVDSSGNTMAADFTSTFTTAAALSTGPFSLWTSSTTPEWTDNPDPRSVELGVRFEATSGGGITGIRFYQSSGNTGTQIVNLWSSAGTLLATATSSSTTGPGWVEIDFTQPVYIAANTVYVASYFTSDGNYGDNVGFFSSGSFSNGPLTALAGVYNYGATSAFPTEQFQNSNYWVDVVLNQLVAPATTDAAAAIVAPSAVVPAATFAAPAAPTISPNAAVASSVVTAAPLAVNQPTSSDGSTSASNTPAQNLSASVGNLVATANLVTAATTAAVPNVAAIPSATLVVGSGLQLAATSAPQSPIGSPAQSTSATPFGGGMAPTDASGGADSAPTNTTPDDDSFAQSAQWQPAPVTDATNESADDWLAAFDGLNGDSISGGVSNLPTSIGVDAYFAAEWDA